MVLITTQIWKFIGRINQKPEKEGVTQLREKGREDRNVIGMKKKGVIELEGGGGITSTFRPLYKYVISANWRQHLWIVKTPEKGSDTGVPM